MFSNFKNLAKIILVLLPFTSFSQDFNMTLRSNLPFPGQTCANIWYYVDSLNNEYALVGASQGLGIVDVTDPDNPKLVKQIPGVDNFWKEVRTYKKFAYVTTEGGGGLQIINLSHLPDTNLTYQNWAPFFNGQTLNTIHSLQITDGYVYLYGGTFGSALIANLEPDPFNPIAMSVVPTTYIHDGYVRNDVLYGGHIANGYFSLVDVSDKANPVLKKTHDSPLLAPHNTWLTDDSKTLFVTDEVQGSFLAAYDISDTSNITELDRIQNNPGSGSIVHNCLVLNDWVVNSYYKDGVVIVDGHRPQNLVTTARYDLLPGDAGCCYAGTWGVCPFLPSGTIVASSIGEGLFVLTPNYVRACYLEGFVTDSVTTFAINRANIQITSASLLDSTKITGDYAVGTAVPGSYDVTFSKTGYISKTILGVSLSAGNVTNLSIALAPIGSGIKDEFSNIILSSYPNPFDNSITLELNTSSKTKPDVLFVKDVTGKIVERVVWNNSSNKIEVGGKLTAGVYFIDYVGCNKPLRIVKVN